MQQDLVDHGPYAAGRENIAYASRDFKSGKRIFSGAPPSFAAADRRLLKIYGFSGLLTDVEVEIYRVRDASVSVIR